MPLQYNTVQYSENNLITYTTYPRSLNYNVPFFHQNGLMKTRMHIIHRSIILPVHNHMLIANVSKATYHYPTFVFIYL